MEGSPSLAFALTLFAGLATGVGSLVVFVARSPHIVLLSFGLGFSGGVMVYVSLVELLPGATDLISGAVGEGAGGWIGLASFFGGMLVSAIIDKLVPDPENPHEMVSLADFQRAQAGKAKPAHEQLVIGKPRGSTHPPTRAQSTHAARTGLCDDRAGACHRARSTSFCSVAGGVHRTCGAKPPSGRVH